MHHFQQPRTNLSTRLNRGRRRGQNLVEFALVASLVLILILGVMQFGLTYFFIGSLNNAAAEGARYGSIHPSSTSAITTQVQTYASGVNTNLLGIDVECQSGSCIAGNTMTVTLTYPLFSVIPGLTPPTIVRSSTVRIESEG